MVSRRSLYICYFPLSEPLVQTQVLPYLRAVVASGVAVTLLTFETAGSVGDPAEKDRLRNEGIDWCRRRYHKRPSVLATLVDVAVGATFVRRRVREGRFDVLHARSYVPGAMAALGRGRRRQGPALLFDMRGFMPEEYVDAGVWRRDGALFKAVKRIEAWLLHEANAIVVLTERARAIVSDAVPDTPVEVIPCCVDLASVPHPTRAAKDSAKRRLGLEGRRVVLYIGSTTGSYLFDEMAAFAVTARRVDPATFFLVLTQRDVEGTAARISTAGLPAGDFSVRSLLPGDVPSHSLAADLALSFIPATYSKQASSPTKIAEYLASGAPVVATAGVGDIDEQLASGSVGVLLRATTQEAYEDALARIETVLQAADVGERCRRTALELFDLASVGGPRYVALYQRMMASASSAMT